MRRQRLYSLDFWVIPLLTLGCLVYLIFGEVFPTDFFLTTNTFKKNSNFVFQKHLNRMMLCSKSFYQADFEKYFQDPELLFENTSYFFINSHKGKKVALVSIKGTHFVAYKYTPRTLWGYFTKLPFQASKAFRSWHYGHLLSSLDINTTKPLLLIEKRLGPFCFSSYLITSYISGVKGAEYFNESSAFKEKWPETTKKILNTINLLSHSKIVQQNFSLNNFIIDGNQPYLVDLDKLHSYPFSHKLYQKRHYKNYLTSLEQDLKLSDEMASHIFQNQALVSNF